jgi:hypothetical protein
MNFHEKPSEFSKRGGATGIWTGLWGVRNRPHRPKKPRRRSLQAATQNCIMVRRTILVPGLHPKIAPIGPFEVFSARQGTPFFSLFAYFVSAQHLEVLIHAQSFH